MLAHTNPSAWVGRRQRKPESRRAVNAAVSSTWPVDGFGDGFDPFRPAAVSHANVSMSRASVLSVRPRHCQHCLDDCFVFRISTGMLPHVPGPSPHRRRRRPTACSATPPSASASGKSRAFSQCFGVGGWAAGVSPSRWPSHEQAGGHFASCGRPRPPTALWRWSPGPARARSLHLSAGLAVGGGQCQTEGRQRHVLQWTAIGVRETEALGLLRSVRSRAVPVSCRVSVSSR